MPITVELTLPEMSVALNAAWLRIVASASKKINHASTYHRPMARRIHEEFIGACGELAIGKAAGVFFVPSVNTFHRVPDFLDGVEVRSTDVATGRLIVRDNDSDERRYVLAIVEGESVSLVGWIEGREAKADKWEENPNGYRPAWFVPQQELRPIETLLTTEAKECHAKPT